MRAYRAPFETPEACLGAIGWAKGFAEGAHQFETPDDVTVKTLSQKPALAIWGMADQTLQAEHFLPLFTEAFPDGTTYHLENVGHYCHEDEPEKIMKLITKFLKDT